MRSASRRLRRRKAAMREALDAMLAKGFASEGQALRNAGSIVIAADRREHLPSSVKEVAHTLVGGVDVRDPEVVMWLHKTNLMAPTQGVDVFAASSMSNVYRTEVLTFRYNVSSTHSASPLPTVNVSSPSMPSHSTSAVSNHATIPPSMAPSIGDIEDIASKLSPSRENGNLPLMVELPIFRGGRFLSTFQHLHPSCTQS